MSIQIKSKKWSYNYKHPKMAQKCTSYIELHTVHYSLNEIKLYNHLGKVYSYSISYRPAPNLPVRSLCRNPVQLHATRKCMFLVWFPDPSRIHGWIPAVSVDEGKNAVSVNQHSSSTNKQKVLCHDVIIVCCHWLLLLPIYASRNIDNWSNS